MPRSLKLLSVLPFLLASVAPAAVVAAPPATFTLPEPSPTSEPETEGPSDDAGSVPVAPNPVETPLPAVEQPETTETVETPSNEASPAAPSLVSDPVVQALPTEPEVAETQPSESETVQTSPPSNSSDENPAPAPVAVDTTDESAVISSTDDQAEINEAEPPIPSTTDAPVFGSADDMPGLTTNLDRAPVEEPAIPDDFANVIEAIDLYWLLGILGAIFLAVTGWMVTRRRSTSPAEIEKPIVPEAAALGSIEEAKLEVELDVINATRSFMMFTLEYRLAIRNRSDKAIRNLSITAELASAQRDQAKEDVPDSIEENNQTKRIERIGPHQGDAITGSVLLRVSDIKPMLQGTKPLFVPLMHVQLRLDEADPDIHTFVIGQPSTASATKLHPIALDDPPGGLPGLRARRLDPEAS